MCTALVGPTAGTGASWEGGEAAPSLRVRSQELGPEPAAPEQSAEKLAKAAGSRSYLRQADALAAVTAELASTRVSSLPDGRAGPEAALHLRAVGSCTAGRAQWHIRAVISFSGSSSLVSMRPNSVTK